MQERFVPNLNWLSALAIEIKAKVMVQPPLDVAGVAVLNLAKLANFLGARLRRDSVSEARSMLDTHTGLFPVPVSYTHLTLPTTPYV